jgi:hypothetical protein
MMHSESLIRAVAALLTHTMFMIVSRWRTYFKIWLDDGGGDGDEDVAVKVQSLWRK